MQKNYYTLVYQNYNHFPSLLKSIQSSKLSCLAIILFYKCADWNGVPKFKKGDIKLSVKGGSEW